MTYDIFKRTAPTMPTPGKGTKIVGFLLSKASKDMQEALLPMIMPALSAHLTDVEFLYSDGKYYPMCGQMGHLVGPSGIGKGQLTQLVEAVMRSFRLHDETEYKKLTEWQRQVKTKGANKEKPERPEVTIWFPPANMTNAAFLQNAIACDEKDRHTQYINMPEVEQANTLFGGHRQVSQMVRNIYDCQRAGALRATAEGVTGNPVLRTNICISSTPYATRKFYKNELFNGTFGRMVFSYKAREERDGHIPRQGKYGEKFYKQLDEYLMRLSVCKGRFVIAPLNKLADQMAEDMASLADLTDDDVLWDASKRSIVSAWKAGCLLWILNDQTWTKPMADLVEWLVYHDLWSKMRIFSDMLNLDEGSLHEVGRGGPKNMLEDLPDSFNEAQLEALRLEAGKTKEGTKPQLRKWVFRKFVTYSAQTGLYTKTAEYLKG